MLNLWSDDGVSLSPKNDREIIPQATDGAALGSATVMWSDLFLASGAVINFNNGDVTITHAANALTFAGVTGGYSFDDDIVLGNGKAIQTGTTASDALLFQAYDNDTGPGYTTFITLTAGNTPTCVLASGVTATTQSASDNSTKLATTAYVDAQVATADSLQEAFDVGQTITVANTDNQTLALTQNDTTNNPAMMTIANTTTGESLTITHNTVTTGNAISLSSDGLTTGSGMLMDSTSTAGTGSNNTKVLEITRSGANSNATHTAYGVHASVTNTGTTSVNAAGYFTASGATTNYAINAAAGDILLGDQVDLVINTTNGTMIGTAAAQKIGFFGITPVVQPGTYAVTNEAVDRTYDANNTSIDELADVLGTLINDLVSLGLVAHT